VRNAAGTAVRFTKPRGIRELVFALPENGTAAARPSVRAAVEGAFVGDFDPDTYRSDRKDLSVQSFTLAAPAERFRQGRARRPHSPRASSWARARTSPAPWSTSRATS
jgi:leucyl aminopeptidase